MVPTLVVSSLLIPSVLSTPRASEDPLKLNLPILMSRGSAPCFIVFASENIAQRNYPHYLLVSDWGRRISRTRTYPCLPASLAVLNFLFDLTIKYLPVFVSDVCRVRLGKRLAEEDVCENAPEQAITFDKAIFPVGEEEESQRIRALLLMENAMQEGASL